MKQAPEPMLSRIYNDWLAAGWCISGLDAFRMEGENDGDGGNGDGGGSGTGGTGDPPKGDPKPPEGISQVEVTRIAAREKAEGKRAAEEAIAKQLGVSVEEAKRIITAAKATEDQQKTEAQRAREQAEAEKVTAEQEKQESAKERHAARVERALLRLLPKDLDDAALDTKVTRISKLVDVEIGADADTITAAVTQLKKEMPELFPESGGAPPPKGGPNGDPKGGPPKGTGNKEDAFNRGMERAKGTSATGSYPILDQLAPSTPNSA